MRVVGLNMSRATIFGNYSQVILPFCVGIVNPPGLDIYGKNEFLYLPTKTLCGLETSQITIFSGRGCYRREFCASKIACAYIWKGFAFQNAAPEGLWVQGGGGGVELSCKYHLYASKKNTNTVQ